ncbi:MAG: hypothetical protein COA71_07825 [SAR86 cluster bacterium]|uniref:Uncharacterized protein n=1 Tax=SAR86 cluster bacterium TaxID=2030880 RepID=A0A2A5CC96_9GAMM|nr:MAG: hypothetical protein COA71_07825 [SAR86 cluster bacterium]
MKTFIQRLCFLVITVFGFNINASIAQPRPPGPPPPPPPGQISAPIDLTGTWVAIITEDWPTRMVTPLIGDTSSIPENQAAKDIAMEWRPEMDVGNECRAYGAAAIMNEPSRLRISWEDDLTLKMEIDSGMQTRYFHFGDSIPAGAPSRQGHTVAHWSGPFTQTPRQFGLGINQVNQPPSFMEAHTGNLIPGYLRKNGIPHSDQATVTEYFDVIQIADGSTWLIDVVIVDDPVYLSQPYVVSRNFKKEADDSKWNPQDCFVTNPGW